MTANDTKRHHPPSKSPHPAGSAALGLLALATALLCGLAAASLIPQALDGAGAQAMLAGVIVLLALLAGAICAYLSLVWGLAALAGARRGHISGRASLRVLRVLAPSLARRIAIGAATATAAGSLALGPAMASDMSSWQEPDAPPAVGVSSVVTPDGRAAVGAELDAVPLEGDPVPDAGAPTTTSTVEDPVPLGLVDPAPSEDAAAPEEIPLEDAPQQEPPQDDPAPAAVEAAEDADEEAADPAEPATASDPAPSGAPATVTVQRGDSLWSISDDLLGPGKDSPQDIARLWPVLYAQNDHVIGADPDHIEPGMVLVVPQEEAQP